MSFVIMYNPLFSVAVEDDVDGARLDGFVFIPTPACRRTLADHQLVWREREGGLQVYYASNPRAVEPLLGRITGRTRFGFAMVLTRPDHFDRYEPDLTPETGPQLYFDNLDANGNVSPSSTLTANGVVATDDAARIHAPIFRATADVSGPGAPTLHRITDKFDGSTVVEVPITSAGAGEVATAIDLSAERAGVYTLETDGVGAVPKTIYVDETLARVSPLGVVDVYWETAQDSAPADGESYSIRFERR